MHAAGAVGQFVGIGSVTMLEGDAGTRSMRFSVTVSQPATPAVSVLFATSTGTATAPGDFVAAGGTVTIPAGQTTGVVNVTINGDATVEPTETFSVTISSPVGATIGRAVGTGRIVNDDAPAAGVKVGIASPTVVEGNTGTRAAWFPVTLSRTSASAVSVHYATSPVSGLAGSDYTTTSGNASIPAGQT